ncbi:hypothetical protein MBM_06664 [Drepanopeziza brunnea f. sp. 'multigermtubi' MB_m1]|uniref:Uncharacterized protein n=1 Tax=Marssonina brunnea f. sp. multigermtubi (strain MB_m1) TaxID=1072389 RepID=K1X424_MARBU|nr:uncharacterized protein MBM_06664 [Drepanopeziza brunnea f. sp. 'multigermtubi' MB_m1]EKD15448.1 hypothetical protein MBM_06664 [Drepanopeziza brunnea f. sp. 'multigermtubi' MB_m1]
MSWAFPPLALRGRRAGHVMVPRETRPRTCMNLAERMLENGIRQAPVSGNQKMTRMQLSSLLSPLSSLLSPLALSTTGLSLHSTAWKIQQLLSDPTWKPGQLESNKWLPMCHRSISYSMPPDYAAFSQPRIPNSPIFSLSPVELGDVGPGMAGTWSAGPFVLACLGRSGPRNWITDPPTRETGHEYIGGRGSDYGDQARADVVGGRGGVKL